MRYFMKIIYPVFFTQTETNVLIEVPDLEILTEGKNLSDAIVMARDAIHAWKAGIKTNQILEKEEK